MNTSKIQQYIIQSNFLTGILDERTLFNDERQRIKLFSCILAFLHLFTYICGMGKKKVTIAVSAETRKRLAKLQRTVPPGRTYNDMATVETVIVYLIDAAAKPQSDGEE